MLEPKTSPRSLVTGATGLLGSHIIERLIAAGERPRALVRTENQFLSDLDVECVVGDLLDPAACRRAVEGMDVVYHSAAKVGDWGPWREFKAGCIDATANLADAALAAGVGRFLHISSTSAYGHPREGGPPVDETAPLGQNVWPFWDYYTRSKLDGENLLWAASRDRGLALTIIRPSWLFGERDRTSVAPLLERIRKRRMWVVGSGDNPLSAIYAGNVADAAILGANHPVSVNQAYNITSMSAITQREWLNLFADACEVPRPAKRINYRGLFAIATAIETLAHLRGRKTRPIITRYVTWLLGRDLSYSTAKARTELGWTPRVDYPESIARTVRWYLEQGKSDA